MTIIFLTISRMVVDIYDFSMGAWSLFFISFLWVVYVQSQFLIFPSAPMGWLDARFNCKNEYGGFLVDIDYIRGQINTDGLQNCTIRDKKYWLGNSRRKTKFMYNTGCYNVTDSFEETALFSEEMSLIRCQFRCYWKYGFALKGKFCKCIFDDRFNLEYTETNFGNCNRMCSKDKCEFIGGINTANIYVTGKRKEFNDGDSCIFIECIADLTVEYKGGSCTNQSGISVYCVNGERSSNISSWWMAIDFCIRHGSYPITSLNQENCTTGLKLWSQERRYYTEYTAENDIFEYDGLDACGSTNFTELAMEYVTNCYEWKQFVCNTDNSEVAQSARCIIALSGQNIESTKGHVTHTSIKSTITTEDNVTIPSTKSKNGVGVSRGSPFISSVITAGIAVVAMGVIALFVGWKRRRNKKHSQKRIIPSAPDETETMSRHMNNTSAFSERIEMNIFQENNLSNRNTSFDEVEGEGAVYYILEKTQSSNYDGTNAPEVADGEYYITKPETDYDHLHQHRKRLAKQKTHNLYSQCNFDSVASTRCVSLNENEFSSNSVLTDEI